MQIQTYPLFYRQRGLRMPNELFRPRISPLESLRLPKASVWHYINREGKDGPELDYPLFSDIKRIIPMWWVTELSSLEGRPRLLPGKPLEYIRQYHQSHRRYRRIPDLGMGSRDEHVPLVVNYSLIERRYRYIDNMFKLSTSWRNLQHTILDEMGKLTKLTSFNQFMFIDLPKILPSVQLLRQASKEVNQSILKRFADPGSLLIFEFWKWLGEERGDSLLSVIPATHYDRINFIIRDSGHYVLFNLGVLNRWRKGLRSEASEDYTPPSKGFPPKKIQLYFLNYLMLFLLVRQGKDTEDLELLDEVIEEESTSENKEVDTTDTTANVVSVDKVGLSGKGKAEDGVKETIEVPDGKALDEVRDELVKVDWSGEFKVDAALDEEVTKDLETLEDVQSVETEARLDQDEYIALKANDTSKPEDAVIEEAVSLAEEGALTAAELRRFKTLATKYQSIKYPGTNKTLEEMAKLNKEDLVLKPSKAFRDNPTVLDKSLLESNLNQFSRQYIENILDTDIANSLLAVQKAGICVTGIERERKETVSGTYDVYKLKLQPVEGVASTVWFKLPVLDKNGSYISNGVKYNYRMQRMDIPIRKIAPDKVALTSYYCKMQVVRSPKTVTDYGKWLGDNIMSIGLDEQNDTVIELNAVNSFDNKLERPRLFSILSQRFGSFVLYGMRWYFDESIRVQHFTEKEFKLYEKDGSVLVAKSDVEGNLLYIDKNDRLWLVKQQKGIPLVTEAPTIESMLGIDPLKAPIDIITVKILGKLIPLGFVLAYQLGLDKLLKSLGVAYRTVSAGARLNLTEDEYRIVFGDVSLILSRRDKVAASILAGLKDYHRELKRYSIYEFDRKDVYLNLLDAVGLNARWLREIDLLFKLFVDPITKDVLEEMGEPTKFLGLLIRSAELLQTDDHPEEMDPRYMRIRGFERIPGIIYNELVKSIRTQYSRVGRANVPIELSPYAIWRTLTTDPAITVANEINPIKNLKEQECVTYAGLGGRSGQTMVKHTREYHPNDLGVISEATVDSSDVGINVYTSANPNLTSVRGITRAFDSSKDGNASLLSTSALLSVASDSDDSKRLGFVSIQNEHTLACSGYEALPVRTGAESVIANRTSEVFATTAKQDGKVTNITDKAITITYKDGSTETTILGTYYAAAAGLTIPQVIVTDLKLGSTVKYGDAISWNKDFFTKDIYSGTVNYKAGLMANVVQYEVAMTNEDASTVSARLAAKLSTRTTKVRDIILTFEQSISDLVKVGDHVESTDSLCLIEDAVSAGSAQFDKASLDTLKLLGSQTPFAKVKGVVERIDVLYNGDLEDMSDSLRALASAYNKRLAAECKTLGKTVYTGEVDEGFRVDNNPLLLDTLVIRIYITSDISFGVGDKLVYAGPMKSVVGDVLPEPIITEDGTEIDVEFGRRGMINRVVNSPDMIGTTATLLEIIGKRAFEIYSK